MQLSDGQRGGEGQRLRSKTSSVLWLLLLGTTLSFLAAVVTIGRSVHKQDYHIQGPALGGEDLKQTTTLLHVALQELQEEVKRLQEELKTKAAGESQWEKTVQELQGSVQTLQSRVAAGARSSSSSSGGSSNSSGTGGAQVFQGGLVPSAMVIVEPRKHHLLQHVLSNFHENMPPHYDLYVFHGKSAGPFARAAVAAANATLRRRVYYRQLDEDDMDPKEPKLHEPWLVPYNLLLRTADFWEQIDAENILVFQTDSVLCPASPWRIQDFEHLGYIGCAHGTEAGYNTTEWKEEVFWGVGGLTFRKKSAVLECIASYEREEHIAEDVFFSACANMGIGRHPDSGVQLAEFCSQYNFAAKSFGAHRLTNMEKSELEPFLLYCPEARAVAPCSGSHLKARDPFDFLETEE